MIGQNEQGRCSGWSQFLTTHVMLYTDGSLVFIWSYQHASTSEVSVKNRIDLLKLYTNMYIEICRHFSPYRPVSPNMLAPSVGARLVEARIGVFALRVKTLDSGEAQAQGRAL
jgi:hypothetical protein